MKLVTGSQIKKKKKSYGLVVEKEILCLKQQGLNEKVAEPKIKL